ncbi:hypothetical protein LTR50_003196 [Elasticomyces elasticus]|nr:hypothetical protein LTR50_003196 [Elasticomyces elasticus]
MLQLILLPTTRTRHSGKGLIVDDLPDSLPTLPILPALPTGLGSLAALSRSDMLHADMTHPHRDASATETAEAHGTYETFVLRLPDDESEHSAEDKLRAEARYYGLDVRAMSGSPDATKAMSTMSVSTAPRRSTSIGSRASQSTGLTSNLSRSSREQHFYASRAHTSRRRSNASLSIRDYDLSPGHPTSQSKLSLSFSPPLTPPHSTFSLPLSAPDSSPRKHFSKLRGLSRLKLRRTASNTSIADICVHCPQEGPKHRPAVHKLQCGHGYCSLALHSIITSAMDGKTAPSCCGRPVPENLIELVMSQGEQDAFVDRTVIRGDRATSYSSHGGSIYASTVSQRSEQNLNRHGSTLAEESGVGIERGANRNLGEALELPEFKALRESHEHERDRFLCWWEREKERIAKEQDERRDKLKQQHDRAVDDLIEQHSMTTLKVEDKHLMDELELLKSHDVEKRNCAVALRHMEAYCNGLISSTSHERHNRPVTEQDRKELAKQYWLRDNLEVKHASAINVLRGEQSHRLRIRQQKQEKEAVQLEREQEMELDSFEHRAVSELEELEDVMLRRRRRMIARWDLGLEIWRSRLDHETGVSFARALPPIAWPDLSADGGKAGAAGAFEAPSLLPPGKQESGISTRFTIRGKSTNK